MKALFCFLLALAGIAPGQAQSASSKDRPFLSQLFSDHMVLQRGLIDPVWGWTTPGTTVSVRVAGKSAKAVSGTDGKWMAKLPPLPVGGPYTLTVAGPQTVTLRDVLVGDVWICSGQSNMGFGINETDNAKAEIAAANFPQLRLFTVPNKATLVPLANPGGPWAVCTPETLGRGFSAVAYFFGRDLQQDLRVPVGLIHTSWGGTPAEAWTSAEALRRSMPDYLPALARLDEQRRSGATVAQQLDAWYAKNDPGSAPGAGWESPAFVDAAWPSMPLPGNWENAGIPELARFDGVVWYRKEIDLPADGVGKPATLHLGTIDDNDTTWINGHRVGATEGYAELRDYSVPAGALTAGRNVIAVRVLDTGYGGGFSGKPEQMSLAINGGPSMPLAGPWHYQIGMTLAKAPLPQQSPNDPTVLYNGMIAPLIPFGVKGAIWYQGESNAGRAYQYRSLLPTMIGDWRSRWGEGNFPFLIVQLANFNTSPAGPAESDWAELREAQWLTSKAVPNTGLATAIDIGSATTIHPTNKQEVGRRLSLTARAQVYGEKIPFSGPVYTTMQMQDNAIRVSFAHKDGGLTAKGGEALKGFSIAGADKKFVWADAKIAGDSVVVSSPAVSLPVAVRYDWAINPNGNLYNGAGLPALPFRTDQWPGVTEGKK